MRIPDALGFKALH